MWDIRQRARVSNQSPDCDRIHGELNQVGIELGSATLVQLRQYDIDPQSVAVRTIRSHRINGIGDSNDPRSQRDIGSSDSVWISAPIPTLVVVANAGNHIPLEPRKE